MISNIASILLFLLIPTAMRINHHRRIDSEESQKKADLIAVRLATRLAWFFGIHLQRSGTPVVGAVLFAANHVSWLDIPVLHSACAMGFVAKAEIDPVSYTHLRAHE